MRKGNAAKLALLFALCVFGIVSILPGLVSAAPSDPQNIAWGGSAPGGVMYYIVGTGGTVITRELPQYNITQVSTGGSTENAKRLVKGELDMGIVYGAHVYQALNQEEGFANGPKGTMIQGVAKLYSAPAYFVTTPDSGIKSMSDLAGKSVAIGPPGSGTVFNSQKILTALGLMDKIKPSQLTFADASRAMANGQIDCFAQSSSPAAAVKELAESPKGAYVIPYTKEEMAAIIKYAPYFFEGVLPEGTYKGVPEMKLPMLTVYWVAHERVPAKVISDILEVVYKDDIKKELAQGYKSWSELAPDTKAFLSLGAKMHPGAEAYYKSKGLWQE